MFECFLLAEKLRDLFEHRPRTEHAFDAKLNQSPRILFGNDATDQHADMAQAGLLHHRQHMGHERHVSPAQQAQAQPTRVLVAHRAHDGFGRLPQPRIDHMKTLITQSRAPRL